MQEIPVFVISLERARDRRALITAHLDRLRIEYDLMDAVEGAQLDPGYRTSVNPRGNMSPGALGCYLSHLRVYEQVIARQIPVALVLEDDTVLHHSVRLLLENGCRNLDFDYCFLGSEDHGDEGFVFYDAGSAVELASGFKAYLLSAGPYCLNAYLITLEGAKKRVACAFPARSAIDHYHYLPYRPRFRAIVPMLAFVNELNAVGSLSALTWNPGLRHLRKRWWFYPLRDLIKLKRLRKLLSLRSSRFPHAGRWQSFSSALKVVPLERMEP